MYYILYLLLFYYYYYENIEKIKLKIKNIYYVLKKT